VPRRDDAVTTGNGGAPMREDLSHIVVELDAIIADIEGATEGNRSLDARLHFGARVLAGHGQRVAGLLFDEGIAWPTIEAALDDAVPRYTTSLDAALEGERVVFVLRSARLGRWVAMQTAAGKEVLGRAATEALARRLVALKAWRAGMSAALACRPAASETTNAGDRDKADPDAADNDGDWRSVEPEEESAPRERREDKDWEVLF
jgi:hypothetical protein